MEDGVPIASEGPPILASVMGSGTKQLKTILALDYTSSMFVVPGAIDAMQAAAQLLINQEPPHALFGIIEFNADYMESPSKGGRPVGIPALVLYSTLTSVH